MTKGSTAHDPIAEDPPAYSAVVAPPSTVLSEAPGQATTTDVDSPFEFLGQFDTVFLIDDSGSMAGASWRETSCALSAISPIVTAQDKDGIEIFFLNHRNPRARSGLGSYQNIRTATSVQEIFEMVRPSGGTPTGTRLNAILKAYLADLSDTSQRRGQDIDVKPLNVIVITDGIATDDVESSIVSAARKLDQMGAEPWQVGIQFFQVGHERAAAQDLQELDDALAKEHGVRDIVDTVPWNGVNGSVLTADGIMKVTMGAINRRLDRMRNSDERLRQR